MILPEDYMDDSNNNSNNKYNDNVKGIEQLLNITSIRNKDDWHDKKKIDINFNYLYCVSILENTKVEYDCIRYVKSFLLFCGDLYYISY